MVKFGTRGGIALDKNITDARKKYDENTSDWRINEIKKYIALNYFEKISVLSIAKEFNITPQYLSNVFKRKTGYTIVGYILNERINNAKRLLLEKDLKVFEIAEMVGYPNPSYFTKIFRRAAGKTPEQYRRDIFK